jgi:uncharacterized membrane protein YbhN (UPF0104 family)
LGAVMFAVAAWVLQRTLARYGIADLHAELAALAPAQVGLAVLYTGLSFAALIGYEWSAMNLIGRRVPFRKLALASFTTQSIAHSTGFAPVVGATLRYQFYADRGLSVLDVAKIQIIFTLTFALGVATLAGGVLVVEPTRLAAATGLPGWAWQVAAAVGLIGVITYIAWGALFHRPFTLYGRVYTLPPAASTLTQIFFGVADLLAVAAALNVLLPASLDLSYLEVLAIFMASIVVGLMSHVPGSLGVFESAVFLLVRPSEDQVLPLLGALLAFRACYYLLPLACGVLLFAGYELVRWRRALGYRLARLTHLAPRATAALVAVSGLLLVLATATPIPTARAERLAAALPHALVGLGNPLCSGLGIGLLVLARGLMLRAAPAWRWGVPMLALGSLVTLATAERLMVWLPLVLALAVLVIARREFARPSPPFATWMTPAWLAFCGIGLAFAALLLVRG